MAKRAVGKRSTGSPARVPRNGYAIVTVTARDANGFVHHYGEIETPLGSLHEALAVMRIRSAEMDAAHRDSRAG